MTEVDWTDQNILHIMVKGTLGFWENTVQFSSVAQSSLTLCDSVDCSTPGFPVHHQLPELAKTHVHQVSDAIQPSHHLSSPSPPVFNFPSIRIFSNELVLCIEKTGWSQILGSPYPIYENLHEQLNLLEPLNIKIVLRINNNPPSKQQKLKKNDSNL